MKNIVKSYLKAYFKNWVEAAGLIIFVIIVFTVLIGLIAIPIQFNVKYQAINQYNTSWNYTLNLSNDKVDNTFSYDFFVKNNTKSNTQDDTTFFTNTPFTTGGQTYQSISDYLAGAYQIADPNAYPTLEAFTGSVINNDMANYNEQTTAGDVVLPNITADQAVVNTAPLQVLVNPYWIHELEKYNFQIGIMMSERLSQTFYQYQYTASANYTFINNNETSYFQIEQTNFHQSNNAIIEGAEKNTTPLGDRQILVSPLYAQAHNLKVGDTLRLNDFVDGEKYGIYNDYQIVGFANKVNNLFPTQKFKGLNKSIEQFGIIYMNDSQVNRYLNYFWANPNLQAAKDFNLNFNQRVVLDSGSSLEDIRQYYQTYNGTTASNITNNLQTTAYQELNSIKQVNILNIQILVFSILGIILLALALIFIQFLLKKEMNQTVRQIGVFKAFGYKNNELSWIFTSKTALTMLLGAVVGYFASWPIQEFVHSVFTTVITIYISPVYTVYWFIIIFVIILPLIFVLFSFFLTWRYVRYPSISLINNMVNSRPTLLNKVVSKLTNREKINFIFKMQMIYTSRNVGKFIIIFIIFFISTLLILLQFDGINFIKALIGNPNEIYQSQVAYTQQLPNLYKDWTYDQSGQKYINNDVQYTNLPTDKYTTYEQLITKANVEPLNSMLMGYITIPRTGTPTSYQQVKLAWDNLKTVALSTKSIMLSTWIQFATQVDRDYITKYQTDVYINPQNIAELVLMQSMLNTAYNPNPILSFNKLFYQQTAVQPMLLLTAENGYDATYNLNKFNLWVSDQNLNRFINTGAQTNLFNLWDINPQQIIISNKLAIINNWKVGDKISINIDTKNQHTIICTIGAIATNDITSNNIYMNSAWFNQTIAQSSTPVYNQFLDLNPPTTGTFNTSDLAANLKTIKLNINSLSYVARSSNYSLLDFCLNIDKTAKYNWSPFTNSNATILELSRELFANAVASVNNSFLIFQIADAVILFIILTVITSAIIGETLNFILVLRSFGYFNNEINFIVIGNYTIEIAVAYLIAYGISQVIWNVISKLVLKLDLVVFAPTGWFTPVIVLLIIAVVTIVGWMMALRNIKHNKVTELF